MKKFETFQEWYEWNIDDANPHVHDSAEKAWEANLPKWNEIKDQPLPTEGEYLVQLEDDSYHVAKCHPKVVNVGGAFAFDRKPIVRWRAIE